MVPEFQGSSQISVLPSPMPDTIPKWPKHWSAEHPSRNNRGIRRRAKGHLFVQRGRCVLSRMYCYDKILEGIRNKSSFGRLYCSRVCNRPETPWRKNNKKNITKESCSLPHSQKVGVWGLGTKYTFQMSPVIHLLQPSPPSPNPFGMNPLTE